ncbi:MAG: MMPL family transporter [Spirochaetaceae bacterium]|jgi:predicted exporter|nr:MMPL family transporter [Spirochaetaceae bacterium]
MKKIFFSQNKSALVWVCFHAAILLAFAVSVLLFPVSINTGLIDILPQSSLTASKADKVFSNKNSSQAIILFANKSFETAKSAAESMAAKLDDAGTFENIILASENAVDELSDYIFKQRYHLLDSNTQQLLENGYAKDIADEALASLFGAFNFSPLGNVELDPFMLSERILSGIIKKSAASAGNMSPKDSVLCAEKDGIWYVMMRVTLLKTGISGSGVEKIYAAEKELRSLYPDLRLYYSGVPFHSFQSSQNAQSEITIITLASLCVILLIFLRVFRTPVPAFASILASLFSIAFGFAGTVIVFKSIHILSFVFGTTLIGSSIDYSIHFFVNRTDKTKTGFEIQKKIFRAVTLSFISTEICFIMLLFAPFLILKQFAVFAIFGMASAWASSLLLFPAIWNKQGQNVRIEKIKRIEKPEEKTKLHIPVYAKRIVLAALVAVFAALVIVFRSNIRIENDIRSLYTISDEMLLNEKTVSEVTDYGMSAWYFIVQGKTEDELLQNEEALSLKLDELVSNGTLKSYLATSMFVPSISKQQESYNAAKKLLPLAAEQFKNIGFAQEDEQIFLADFYSNKNDYAKIDDNSSEYFKQAISNIYLGNIDGFYYSCVLPLKASGEKDIFKNIAASLDNVHFINKTEDISKQLDSLTKTMLTLFICAYIIIVIITKIIYPLRSAVKICIVPLIAMLSVTGIFALFDMPLGFFSAAGFVLIFGLGIDYMFYITEQKNKIDKKTITAIILSFVTTAISFGALSLSSFVPVHILGLTVFSGLTGAFVSAMLIKR